MSIHSPKVIMNALFIKKHQVDKKSPLFVNLKSVTFYTLIFDNSLQLHHDKVAGDFFISKGCSIFERKKNVHFF